ncbi:MAG: carboxypeptidase M32 [Alphaproteobacteria bacterium]|nr:carboxypeptidase M32 [Alphaproteobacteria bacterium]
MTAAYPALETRFKRISLVREASGVLEWDRDALMPPGGSAARTEQLATLQVLAHQMITDPAIGDLIGRAEQERNGLDLWQKANLKRMGRQWRHATCLPEELVEALSRATSECEMAWRGARAASDFKSLLPLLQRVLDLVRETAAIKAKAFGLSLYDALLDESEPDTRSAEITALFDSLAAFLPGFIDAVLERQARQPAATPPAGPFPVAKQEALARRLMQAVGFDFAHGRLDTSAHPFCGGVPDDVRLTTRWDEADFMPGLMGVLHETGHAMYERGLPAAWRHQPVGHALSTSLHESQSLLVEMQACRSREFIAFLAPLAAQAFGGEGPAWSADHLYRIYTKVERSFIRVDADEATYPAHVILRYRLESAMIAGDLKLADLPGAWAGEMKRLLGVVPPDDRRGCLQDIHWPLGAWAYFPSYTLGAMTAAQFIDAARRAVPGIPAALGRGDFSPLMDWLRANVHSKGSSLSARELITAATGKPLDPEIYKRHLTQRYLNQAASATA